MGGYRLLAPTSHISHNAPDFTREVCLHLVPGVRGWFEALRMAGFRDHSLYYYQLPAAAARRYDEKMVIMEDYYTHS